MDHVTQLQGDLTDDVLAALTATGRVAWDIETSGLDWRRGRIGTCQIHSYETGAVIIQLKDNGRPHRLATLLADESVLKVFHHAPFDLRWMTTHWETSVASVACTKVASRLLNRAPESQCHSLKYLLAEYLGVHVDKGERTSNWLALDLTDAQVAYAAEDVVHLLALHDILTKHLDNEGLSTTYQHCIEFLPTRVMLETGGWPDVFAY
ncbi:MAG: ribonuclease D [Actinomycetota bacterium]|nr:ribonuclease D [Actinomycetota bacterium]